MSMDTLAGMGAVMLRRLLLSFALLQFSAGAGAQEPISLSIRDTDIAEVMEMLAQKARVNVLLSKGVEGSVSLSLFDVNLEDAIHAVARAAGYAVEHSNGTYFVIKPEQAGPEPVGIHTQVRTFKVQYSDPVRVSEILQNHLTPVGKVTALAGRQLLVVEDAPDSLQRVRAILRAVDVQPQQILIEAKILEIALDDGDTYGLDWAKLLNFDGGEGSFGIQGFSAPTSPGLYLSALTPNIQVALTALKNKGRVRTLSTPKLLALEGQEASVVIGDRIGYRVTTTINQVTNESIEFLESGVILRVKPSVDGDGRVMMEIHPEVSNGSVSDGIPSQTTTEVTTQFLSEDGQTIFIGGLMKNTISESRNSIPVLGGVPVLGRLFSKQERISVNTETVVLITAHIAPDNVDLAHQLEIGRLERKSSGLASEAQRIESAFGQDRPLIAAEGEFILDDGYHE